MSAAAGHDADPFAGYTPVKVKALAAEGGEEKSLPAPTRRYRFGKKREGDFARTGKLFAIGIASLILVVGIAAVAHGVIYARPADGEELDFLSSYTNQIRRLGDWGREARAKVETAVLTRWTGTDEKAMTNRRLVPAVTNVVAHRQRVSQVHREVEGGTVPPIVDSGDETSVTAGQMDKPTAEKRTIDPSLKRFYNGGRKGRAIR